jgi:hypothetical protein
MGVLRDMLFPSEAGMNDHRQDLKELLVRKKQQAEAAGPVDWSAVRDRWMSDLAGLCTEIRGWLGSLEREGLLTIEGGVFARVEEQLGAYDAPFLKLRFPEGEVVEVRPVARVVLGAKGRVDVTLGARRFMLFRVEPGKWELVEGLSPISTLPLTEEVFLSALFALLDGE